LRETIGKRLSVEGVDDKGDTWSAGKLWLDKWLVAVRVWGAEDPLIAIKPPTPTQRVRRYPDGAQPLAP
jgi:hypothetical protein